jgi:hypothetical protein
VTSVAFSFLFDLTLRLFFHFWCNNFHGVVYYRILTWFYFFQGLLAEMSGNKSERSLSPAAMSEEGRRELIARQHRALYGNDSPAFYPPGTSSPNSGANPSYSLYDASAEQPVTSTSSPGGADSPSSRQLSSKSTAGPIGSVGPIGSRPSQQTGAGQAPNPALNKRSTTPLPSPLGYGFAPNENANSAASGNERSTSSASNPASSAHAAGAGGKEASNPVGLGWGNSSGVWGSKNTLGVQASVWG